ncbi:MAG TPA: hypothetical protein VFK06_22805, partial [Candidatus Angelobacter sp.]|nr:hypothetical protein [Candidatus Angelobacter sp.]
MSDKRKNKVDSEETLSQHGESVQDKKHDDQKQGGSTRRSFLGKAGGLTAVALAAAVAPIEPLLGGKESSVEASTIPYNDQTRAAASFNYRTSTANAENIDLGVLPDNGDKSFTDHSGLWSKALPHDSLEVVNQNAWATFVKALSTGNFTDFENIIVGHPGGLGFTQTLNGPMAAFALDLEGLDSHATSIPPSPTTASAQTAAEQVEHYWAVLLRDTNFTQYANSSIAQQAVNELNSLSFIKGTDTSAAGTGVGPNAHGSPTQEYPNVITTQNLFRGFFNTADGTGGGNLVGPFVSQFLLQPTFFGAQPLSQMYQNFLPGQEFMTSVAEFENVENGGVPTGSLQFDPQFRFLRNGRGLAAYTHVDALHQAYFTAALVLLGINAPAAPGNPYIGSKTQHGFGTLGGPDALGTVSEFATRALKAAWFHKWIVNLRMRPEEFGGLVHANLAGVTPLPQAAAVLHKDVLKSQIVQIIKQKFGSFLLPIAFPEGAPAHPCYPTGHGTVGGACITALKFFFDGNAPLRPILLAAGSDIMQASEDGLSLVPYTGADRDSITINGELNKLAFNITSGHGIHAGIHFRSSSYWAIKLGEQ